MPRTRTRFDFVALANQFAAASDDALLPTDITAAGLGYSSTSSLDVMACHGGGPPYIKRNNGRRLYEKRNSLAWLAQRSTHARSTSDYPQGQGSSVKGSADEGLAVAGLAFAESTEEPTLAKYRANPLTDRSEQRR